MHVIIIIAILLSSVSFFMELNTPHINKAKYELHVTMIFISHPVVIDFEASINYNCMLCIDICLYDILTFSYTMYM